MTLNVRLPNLREDDFIKLEEKLSKYSIVINGQLIPGGLVELVIFKSKETKITDYLNFLIKDKQQYPIEWVK